MPALKKNPTLKDIQAYVVKLEQERSFDKNTVLQKSLLLAEEVGELLKALRKSHAGMRYATNGYEAHPEEEMADILIVLCTIANRLNVDLEQTFRDKEEKNKKRTWA